MAEKDTPSNFQNFLIQLKNLCDAYLLQTQEPLDTPQPQPVKHKKTKRQKDPLAPKMPKSAFIYYFQEKRERFQSQYPDLQFSEITKLIASEWKDLPKEKQQIYHSLAEQDRSRYQHEQQVYGHSNGKTSNGKQNQKSTKLNQKKEKQVQIEINDVQQDSFGADIGQD